ncbi:NUDIX domain-containing protein [Candidatus Micrarchaeota archaeon]|nr:NUDIX domain-containing protein [Candidatus Micrarchaeota archaeon]
MAGTCLYYQEKGRIKMFLAKRPPDKPYPHKYVLGWGGHLEKGETPEQALLRELSEEMPLVKKKNLRDIKNICSILETVAGNVTGARGTIFLVRISKKKAGEIIRNTRLLKESYDAKFVPLEEIEKIHSASPEKFLPHYVPAIPHLREWLRK